MTRTYVRVESRTDPSGVDDRGSGRRALVQALRQVKCIAMQARQPALEHAAVGRRHCVHGDVGNVRPEMFPVVVESFCVLRASDDHPGVDTVHPEVAVLEEALEDDQAHVLPRERERLAAERQAGVVDD